MLKHQLVHLSISYCETKHWKWSSPEVGLHQLQKLFLSCHRNLFTHFAPGAGQLEPPSLPAAPSSNIFRLQETFLIDPKNKIQHLPVLVLLLLREY